MNIEGKHVVVAGGSSGIGFAIAQLALERGASVTIAGRSENKLVDAAKRLVGRAQSVVMDLGDTRAAKVGFRQIGAFDHFVSTAADLTYGPLATMARAAIIRMLAGKFWGPINLMQHGLSTCKPAARFCCSPAWLPTPRGPVLRWCRP